MYIPVLERVYDADDTTYDIPLSNENIIQSVALCRGILEKTCLRTSTRITASIPVEQVPNTSEEYQDVADRRSFSYVSSVGEYADIVDEFSQHIPAQYAGHVSGVLKTDHAYIFRHTSRFCMNVEREHHSSNIYFLITRHGARQCCYSRKDDNVGQKHCLCEQFRGDILRIPQCILDKLFPEAAEDARIIALAKLPNPTPNTIVGNIADAVIGIACDIAKHSLTKKHPSKSRYVSRRPKKIYHPGSVVNTIFV
jgi:hypothetical protein